MPVLVEYSEAFDGEPAIDAVVDVATGHDVSGHMDEIPFKKLELVCIEHHKSIIKADRADSQMFRAECEAAFIGRGV